MDRLAPFCGGLKSQGSKLRGYENNYAHEEKRRKLEGWRFEETREAKARVRRHHIWHYDLRISIPGPATDVG